MTAKGKILVTINPAPEDITAAASEEDCEPPHFLIADAIVETFDRRGISVVELRMVVPSKSAQAMLRGMLEGKAEIAITEMSVVGLH